MSTSQNFPSNQGQECWAAIIEGRCRDYLKKKNQSSVPDIEEHHPSGPCVFEVPKSLLDTKPEAYTPKTVGLGPFHHLRSDLKQTPKQKLEALENLLKNKDVDNFIHAVARCSSSFEKMIRLCYDGHLDLDGQSLAWIVIIDSIYLLHSIQVNSSEQGPSENPDAASSIRDLLMLENQIPMCLIRQMESEFHRYSLSVPSDKIVDFCRKHSPFPTTTDGYSVDEAFGKSYHMLDIMHQLTLGPEIDELSRKVGTEEGDRDDLEHAAKVNYLEHLRGTTQYAASKGKELADIVIDGLLSVYKVALEGGFGPTGKVGNLVKFVEKLKSSSSSDVKKKHFPSVSQLHQVAQITFSRLPSGFGLRAVMFEEKNKTVYLPVLKLVANSEVILRNLMAYEAKSSKPGSEVIDFVEFMYKIIKDQNDVKLLRSATIIEGGLQDKEIVELFNNLEKAIENTDRKKSNSIFSAIVDKLNELFNNERVVKACGWITDRVVAFFKFLILMLPIFVLLLLLFQSFCEIYDCRRLWKLSFEPFGEVGRGDRYPSGKASVLSLETHAELLPARKLLRY